MNKVQNKVFNLKQLVDNIILILKACEVVTPSATYMWSMFLLWELQAKDFMKQPTKQIIGRNTCWKVVKGILLVPSIVDSQYGQGDCIRLQKQIRKGIRGDSKGENFGKECLSLDITWAQKTPKSIELWATWIQASAKAFVCTHAWSNLGWSILIPTWATHYGGTGEIHKNCMSEIVHIDQMTTLCWWIQPNGNERTMLKGFGRRVLNCYGLSYGSCRNCTLEMCNTLTFQ